jgi:hypothetical protein
MPRDVYARRLTVPREGVKALAHRKPIIDQANDIAAMVMEQCKTERVSLRVLRMQRAQLLTSEFAEMNQHIQRSLDQHGEVTERCERYLRENLQDLLRNTFGISDMPTTEAATSLAAD